MLLKKKKKKHVLVLNFQSGMDISSVHSRFCLTLTGLNVKTTVTAPCIKTFLPTNFGFRRFKKSQLKSLEITGISLPPSSNGSPSQLQLLSV